ncbi:MAG: Gfo/Idh/MocA family oxidoreductase, partial [Planctomycetota bacterium]
MKQQRVSRRRFIGASASLTALSWSSLSRAQSSLSTIRVGVIGTGVRGKYLMGNLPDHARVIALCDCSMERIADTLKPHQEFEEVLAKFIDRDATSAKRYQDYRIMIDRERLDAVIIATPDHHHVQTAMLALDAGLDVYVEKPLSLTIREGRLLAEKVSRTKRVLQVGSQQRTMELNRFACQFIRDGGLGRVHRVDCPNYPGPITASDFDAEPIPSGLDWDLFIGPTAMRPHNRKLWIKDAFKVDELLWRGWDLFRDYSGHLMTNWGAHSIDMVQYALGMDESGPVRIAPLSSDMSHLESEQEVALDVSESALERDWQTKWHKKTPRPAARFSDARRVRPVTM